MPSPREALQYRDREPGHPLEWASWLADGRHLPGVFQAQDVGEGHREPGYSGPDVQVHVVDPRGPNPDQRFPCFGFRIGSVLVHQDLGAAELAEPRCFHRCLLLLATLEVHCLEGDEGHVVVTWAVG